MGQFDASIRGLPVVVAAGTGSSTYRGRTAADFLSQLIAERQNLAPQRDRRRAAVAEVLRTYDSAGRLAIRRLPPGYRTSIEV